jgi:hypothetical protein
MAGEGRARTACDWLSTPTMGGVENDSVNLAWTIDVTDDDIRAAKREWNRAQDAADPDNDRIAGLYDDYRRLVIAQAQQIADDFRARRAG